VGRLYVARHPETDFNRDGRYQGQRESRLTDVGIRQADALAQALATSEVQSVFSSPLERCAQTARAVAARHALPVIVDSRLLEIAHGTWEGRLRRDIERDDRQRMRAWRSAPDSVTFEGGESLMDVNARWLDFTASLDADANAVVVTHDVIVRLAILSATNRPPAELWSPRVCNGGYALIDIEGAGASRRFTLVAECERAHLGLLHVDPSAQAL
jgi:phosphoserine phosphatase